MFSGTDVSRDGFAAVSSAVQIPLFRLSFVNPCVGVQSLLLESYADLKSELSSSPNLYLVGKFGALFLVRYAKSNSALESPSCIILY